MENLGIELLWPGVFTISDNGYRHCKTVPYYIFAQALEGRYALTAGNERANCSEGGAFLTRPNVPLIIDHFVNPDTGRMRVCFLHFRLQTAAGLDAFASYRLPLVLAPEAAKPLGALVLRLAALPATEQTAAPALAALLRRDTLALQFFSRLTARLTPDNRQAAVPPGIARAMQIVGERRNGAIFPEELAAAAGLSRSLFYQKFSAAAGMTPAEYILRERINYAAGLLLSHPEYSVKETAHRSGWKNPFHFSRAFKKILGCPPAVYRDSFYL